MEAPAFLVHEGECRISAGHGNGQELPSISGGKTIEQGSGRTFSDKQDEASAFYFCHRSRQMGKDRKKMDTKPIYEENVLPLYRHVKILFLRENSYRQSKLGKGDGMS